MGGGVLETLLVIVMEGRGEDEQYFFCHGLVMARGTMVAIMTMMPNAPRRMESFLGTMVG